MCRKLYSQADQQSTYVGIRGVRERCCGESLTIAPSTPHSQIRRRLPTPKSCFNLTHLFDVCANVLLRATASAPSSLGLLPMQPFRQHLTIKHTRCRGRDSMDRFGSAIQKKRQWSNRCRAVSERIHHCISFERHHLDRMSQLNKAWPF